MPNHMRRPRPAQQDLPLPPPKPGRGGKRTGAGRKPTHSGPRRVRHVTRPAMNARFPTHVTIRMCRDMPRLRNFELVKVLRRAFVHGCRRGGSGSVIEFRICQFSIQGNHIHLICEATTNKALARGIQGWAVRMAHGLNTYLGRTGRVFDDRHHVRVLKTPTQTRHALCYVLQNARRHHERIDNTFNGMDPFSSAWWFDGWDDNSWRAGLSPPEVRTVAVPESWLLKQGWKRSPFGLLSLTEVPPAGLH